MQGAVRPVMVVGLAPAFSQDLYLLEGIEDLPVEELVTHLAIEGLDIAVLPGAARLDKQSGDPQSGQQLSHPYRRELRTVV